MKIVITDAIKSAKLSIIFSNLKSFASFVTLRFKEEGLYMQVMDFSKVCLFECNIHKDWFNEYDFQKSDDIESLTLSSLIISKIISTFVDGQTMTISANNTSDKVSMSFTGSNSSYNKHFEMPIIDNEDDIVTIPNSSEIGTGTSEVDIALPSSNFAELIGQFQVFNDTIQLTFSDEGISMMASGDEGSMTADMSLDDVIEYSIAEDTTLVQSFALRYISTMCSFGKITEEVSMEFNEHYPMVLIYNFGETESESTCNLRFYLAPKIED